MDYSIFCLLIFIFSHVAEAFIQSYLNMSKCIIKCLYSFHFNSTSLFMHSFCSNSGIGLEFKSVFNSVLNGTQPCSVFLFLAVFRLICFFPSLLFFSFLSAADTNIPQTGTMRVRLLSFLYHIMRGFSLLFL